MGETIPPVFETKILTNKTTSEFLKNSMGVALNEDVPTKTSELENDSEFVDKDFVNSSIAVKQDKLPYNDQWDVYNVGCWSAVNATRDVNGDWINTTYAKKTELPTNVVTFSGEYEDGTTFSYNVYIGD